MSDFWRCSLLSCWGGTRRTSGRSSEAESLGTARPTWVLTRSKHGSVCTRTYWSGFMATTACWSGCAIKMHELNWRSSLRIASAPTSRGPLARPRRVHRFRSTMTLRSECAMPRTHAESRTAKEKCDWTWRLRLKRGGLSLLEGSTLPS